MRDWGIGGWGLRAGVPSPQPPAPSLAHYGQTTVETGTLIRYSAA